MTVLREKEMSLSDPAAPLENLPGGSGTERNTAGLAPSLQRCTRAWPKFSSQNEKSIRFKSKDKVQVLALRASFSNKSFHSGRQSSYEVRSVCK